MAICTATSSIWERSSRQGGVRRGILAATRAAGFLGSLWSKTACWEKKTRSLSLPWSTKLSLGKFFRRSGTMTLSATFLAWGNSRAVLLPARAFAAYCGKRRKIVRERYEKFPQQGLFDHGAGRARARLEWEAVLPAVLPSKLLRELAGRTGRAAGGLALACVVAVCVCGQRRMSIGAALLRWHAHGLNPLA